MVGLLDMEWENNCDCDVKCSNGQSGQHTSTQGPCEQREESL